MDSLQEITRPLIEQKEKFQNDLLGFQTRVDECQAALTVSSNELKICQHSETSERKKYNTFKQSLDDAKAEFDQKKTQLAELQTDLPQAKEAAANFRKELSDRKNEEKELTAQLRRLRTEVDEKTRAMNAMQSNNKIVNGLLTQKKRGVDGFEGVLGRLVSRCGIYSGC